MIELGDVDAGGDFPIWPQSDCVDFARGTLIIITLAGLALSLLLFLPIEEELHMPGLPSKTAETPENELPFPGKLVDGRYDVQHLHL